MSRVLKEQFVIEIKGDSTRESHPFDQYPTQAAIDAFLGTLSKGRRWYVRVAKYYTLVEESSPSEDEETARLRNDHSAGHFNIVQAIEGKLAECGYYLRKPKRILMSRRQGRAMIPDPTVMTQPPVSYRGIPISYIMEDMDEPLVCW